MNHICENFACLHHECGGTHETVWTGCTHRHMNVRENDTVTVHFFSGGKEFQTEKSGVPFMVHKIGGQLGISWNTESKPYVNGGQQFVPFSDFAASVVFRRMEDGFMFRYSELHHALIRI